jgi:FixJ family two-component response regulator
MVDVDVLTARELQVLSLTCAGHSAQEIADRLRISRCTVENHKLSGLLVGGSGVPALRLIPDKRRSRTTFP